MRSLRPMAESLETRQLLSIDHSDDSHGSRQGNGPRRRAVDAASVRAGCAQRRGHGGDTFHASTQNLQESILTITVGGLDQYRDALVGTVKPSSTGNRTSTLKIST